mgnify:CR=1 FL=1
MDDTSENRSLRNNTIAAVILAAGLGERFEGEVRARSVRRRVGAERARERRAAAARDERVRLGVHVRPPRRLRPRYRLLDRRDGRRRVVARQGAAPRGRRRRRRAAPRAPRADLVALRRDVGVEEVPAAPMAGGPRGGRPVSYTHLRAHET